MTTLSLTLWERRIEQTRISAKEQGTHSTSECQRRDACCARHLQVLLCLPRFANVPLFNISFVCPCCSQGYCTQHLRNVLFACAWYKAEQPLVWAHTVIYPGLQRPTTLRLYAAVQPSYTAVRLAHNACISTSSISISHSWFYHNPGMAPCIAMVS